jgi:peroxiredoxin
MPDLQALHEERSEDGLTVLGISIDQMDRADVRKFVDRKKLTYSNALDTAVPPAWETFRVAAVPALFLVDRRGEIVRQWTGKVDHAEVRREVDRLLTAAP